MWKVKNVFVFALWIMFWWLISSLFIYSYYNDILNQNENVKVETTSMLENIKNKLSNVSTQSWEQDYSSNNDYEKFDQIWDILKEQYYYEEDLDYDDMFESALKAFVESTWDPYNVYLSTDENESFQEWLEGQQDFEWIGAVVGKRQDWVIIEELIQWAPAFEAWLIPMDIIVQINWTWTQDLSLQEAVDKIRWPQWTTVDLRIQRNVDWETEFLDVEVIRDEVNVPSVRWEIKEEDDNNIWYIKISIFWDDTQRALQDLIDWFDSDEMDWVILDLRWNWWWFLPMAVSIASYFIPEWMDVVSTNYRTYPSEDYESEWNGFLEDLPLVVLVDEISASASEIIAAALREQVWAKIVWKKTFGKWSIQTLYDFDDWSSLKYTIWAWYPPSWYSVDREWLKPDYEVDFDIEHYEESNVDLQIEKAKEVLIDIINE